MANMLGMMSCSSRGQLVDRGLWWLAVPLNGRQYLLVAGLPLSGRQYHLVVGSTFKRGGGGLDGEHIERGELQQTRGGGGQRLSVQ